MWCVSPLPVLSVQLQTTKKQLRASEQKARDDQLIRFRDRIHHSSRGNTDRVAEIELGRDAWLAANP